MFCRKTVRIFAMDYVVLLSSAILFGVSMCFTPGPNNAMAMSTGLTHGFRAALPLCFGAGIGANVTLLLLGFGLTEVFIRFPLAYTALRYAGAVYMLWLAWKIAGLRLPSSKEKTGGSRDLRSPSGKHPSAGRDGAEARGVTPLTFLQAVLLQLVNVKVWLTNIIIVSNFVGTGPESSARLWLMVALYTCLGTSAIALWAAGGAVMRRFLSSDGMRRANYLFALFLVFSVALLFVGPSAAAP